MVQPFKVYSSAFGSLLKRLYLTLLRKQGQKAVGALQGCQPRKAVGRLWRLCSS